jgi:hypothetical protein
VAPHRAGRNRASAYRSRPTPRPATLTHSIHRILQLSPATAYETVRRSRRSASMVLHHGRAEALGRARRRIRRIRRDCIAVRLGQSRKQKACHPGRSRGCQTPCQESERMPAGMLDRIIGPPITRFRMVSGQTWSRWIEGGIQRSYNGMLRRRVTDRPGGRTSRLKFGMTHVYRFRPSFKLRDDLCCRHTLSRTVKMVCGRGVWESNPPATAQATARPF